MRLQCRTMCLFYCWAARNEEIEDSIVPRILDSHALCCRTSSDSFRSLRNVLLDFLFHGNRFGERLPRTLSKRFALRFDHVDFGCSGGETKTEKGSFRLCSPRSNGSSGWINDRVPRERCGSVPTVTIGSTHTSI